MLEAIDRDGEGTSGMGRANQQQRKRKHRAPGHQPHAGGPAGTARPGAQQGLGGRPDQAPGQQGFGSGDRAPLRERAEALVLTAGQARLRHDVAAGDEAVGRLLALAPEAAEVRVVQQALAQVLRRQLRQCWQRGWQPVDVHQVLGRSTDATVRLLAGDVMADELVGYAAATLDPAWTEQLAAVGAARWWPSSRTWPQARSAEPGLGWPLVLEASIVLLAELARLGRLDRFLPLPGETAAALSRSGHADQKVLQRVRQMLAQAESTSFEAEADSFTAAAQRLMARHSIDQAMLAASADGGGDEAPTGRRVWVERPYVKEKVLLLHVVSEPNRTRALWSTEMDMVTLLGHGTDLDTVETLYTSLLVQATRAMQAEGGRVSANGSSRTRGFRRSFLAAYAHRIGERLRAAAEQETRAAAAEFDDCTGHALVPVLQAREQAVDDYADRLFPRQVRQHVSAGSDREGWVKGRIAADRAHVAAGPSLGG